MRAIKDLTRGKISWQASPMLAGLSCLGVAILMVGVGVTLMIWSVPYNIWKAIIWFKLLTVGAPKQKDNVVEIWKAKS